LGGRGREGRPRIPNNIREIGMSGVLVELMSIAIAVCFFTATFEPMRSLVFKKPLTERWYLLIRIGSVIVIIAAAVRIYMLKAG
jgi:hypothetical protein